MVSGIESGNRLPSVPRVQGAASATVRRPLRRGTQAFLTGTYQYVGSRYTQIDDLAAGFGTVNIASFGRNTIGGPLTASSSGSQRGRASPLSRPWAMPSLRC